jgi:hypothetical protein
MRLLRSRREPEAVGSAEVRSLADRIRALGAALADVASSRDAWDRMVPLERAIDEAEKLDDEDHRALMVNLLANPGKVLSAWTYHGPNPFRSKRAKASIGRPEHAPALAGAVADWILNKRSSLSWTPAVAVINSGLSASAKVASTKEEVDALARAASILIQRFDKAVRWQETIGGHIFGFPPASPPGALLDLIAGVAPLHPDVARRLVADAGRGPSILGQQMRALSDGFPGSMALAVLDLIKDGTKPEPRPQWVDRAEKLRTEFPADAPTTLALMAGGRPSEYWGADAAVRVARGAVWMLAGYRDTPARQHLVDVIAAWNRSGAGGPAVGSAAIWALAQPRDDESIRLLLAVQQSLSHRTLKKRCDAVLQQLASGRDLSRDDLADAMAPDGGLDATGRLVLPVGEHELAYALDVGAVLRTSVRDADRRVRSDVPAAAKKAHPVQWKAALAAKKTLAQAVSRERSRAETAMVDGRRWTLERWRQVFGGNPLLGSLARGLVWRANLVTPTCVIPDGAGFIDYNGQVVPIPDGTGMQIVHPVELSAADQSAWQQRIVRSGTVQPFKQLFRETYVATPVELEVGGESRRFAGHAAPLRMVFALTKGRGWDGKLGLEGFDGAGQGHRDFPTWGARAHLVHGGGVEDAVIETVAFTNIPSRHAPPETIMLSDVPPIPFSEAMRDVDLLVAVGSGGTDATWLEWEKRRLEGRERWDDTMRAYAHIAAATTARRAEMLRDLIPRLGLSGRAHTEGHFVLVDGVFNRYRIHLGTANIHIEPSGRYLCIVASSSGGGAGLYIPFVDDSDRRTWELVSKMVLLAQDDRIRDSSIISQLGR